MILLFGFAFLAGIVTILSPCILPVLPIILSSTVGGQDTGYRRPIGVTVGFIASFTFFTLFLSLLVRALGISADILRIISIIIIASFGLSLIIPWFQRALERVFSRLARIAPTGNTGTGFWPGLLVGLSLGLLWTPCVGPILASVIALALTGTVTLAAAGITFAYALGTAIPMLAIMVGGRALLTRVPWLTAHTGAIQRIFGIFMIITAIAIATNLDRKFQTYVITRFPGYGAGLTALEDRASVQRALDDLHNAEGQGNVAASLPISAPRQETEKKNAPSKQQQRAPVSSQKKKASVSPVEETRALEPQYPIAPEIIPGGQWFHSTPLTLAQLRGKVVVVDFWTYSCINCQRTLPYLKRWYSTYKDKGLVIIGVHAPEFEFEKSAKNLAAAIKDFGLEYPIVQDNDFATWRAYGNRYWPAKYFIDQNGYVRYTHFGEGAYDESEQVIRTLLEEAGASIESQGMDNPSYQNDARTPETYLGYGRMEYNVSPETVSQNAATTYTAPASIPVSRFALNGTWTIAEEYARPTHGASLTLHFDAREVFLVMRPRGASSTARVLVDTKAQFAGMDVHDGVVTVDTDRLYKLVNLPTPGEHTLTIEFDDSNIELYAFTFG